MGHSVQSFLTDSKKESMADVLKQIRAAHPTFKAISVVLDNYSSPISDEVARQAQAPGIARVFLPPDSPDLNPIEYIWKSIERVLSVDFVPTLEAMKQTIADAWHVFSGRLSFAKHWISEFLESQKYYRD